MTTPVSARLDVARRLATYAADPAVAAVLCAGSTGRGDADRWSDLELLVLWSAERHLAESSRLVE